MSGNEGVTGFWQRLFGRREPPSPAEAWLEHRSHASPEDVIGAHFAAMQAHDLDWFLATMTPERAKLHANPRTVDKSRKTVLSAQILEVRQVAQPFPAKLLKVRYRSVLFFRVEYALKLVDQDRRRDPSLREGVQWAYYVLVTEGRRNPWLIADWGN